MLNMFMLIVVLSRALRAVVCAHRGPCRVRRVDTRTTEIANVISLTRLTLSLK